MDEGEFLAGEFEAHRGHLTAVAYRMLGSLAEADDAVQEAWLRLSRTDTSEVRNLGGWLTTVVGRVCLDMLRARSARREEPLDGGGPLEREKPLARRELLGRREPLAAAVDPEQEAVLADSVGLALLVVLESLNPAERLAFVLHDMFAVPFDEIAPLVGRTPAAAKMLASRARQRVRGATPAGAPDRERQRTVVRAFLAAARGGDLDALVAVLHPDVVLRADRGAAGRTTIRGARTVAGQALAFSRFGYDRREVTVDGAPGLVSTKEDRPMSLMTFSIVDDRIVVIEILADPERLAAMDLAAMELT